VPDGPVLLVALVVGLAIYRVVDGWYARHYGHVVDAGGRERRSIAKWLIVYPAMGASLVADAVLAPPIFISRIVWALAILGYRASTGGGRRHYLVVAGVTAALTLLPVVGLTGPGRDAFAVFFGWLGIVYTVGGLLDHRELVQALRPLPGRDASRPEPAG
jgi:hypothetical protein